MVTRGRNICNTLKAIRKQIADANEIEYSPEECHFKVHHRGPPLSKTGNNISISTLQILLKVVTFAQASK